MSEDETDGPFTLTGTLEIPVPQRSYHRRGRASGKKADAPTTFRFSQDERQVMSAACEVLGIKQSEYLRWLAFYVSNEVLKKHLAWERKKRKK